MKGNSLLFHGKEFPVTGDQKAPFHPGGAQTSEDGHYLAVSCWLGNFASGGQDYGLFDPMAIVHAIFHRPYGGAFSVDIYDTRSGAIDYTFHGRIIGDISDLNGLFQRPVWLSNRYYVFPVDQNAWDEFFLCDAQRPRSGTPDSHVITFTGALPKHTPAEMDPQSLAADLPPMAKITAVTDSPLLDPDGQPAIPSRDR